MVQKSLIAVVALSIQASDADLLTRIEKNLGNDFTFEGASKANDFHISSEIVELKEDHSEKSRTRYFKARYSLKGWCSCEEETLSQEGCICDHGHSEVYFEYIPKDETNPWAERHDEAIKKIIGRSPEGLEPDDIKIEWVKELPHRYINVYKIDRAYGGPEEGGWYFDCGTCELSIPLVPGVDQKKVIEHLENEYSNEGRPSISSVCSRGEYRIAVQYEQGENYPKEIPSYC